MPVVLARLRTGPQIDSEINGKPVVWMPSRLTICLLNLKRPQLIRVVQVLTGHCNLQRHKKIIGRAESFLCQNVT